MTLSSQFSLSSYQPVGVQLCGSSQYCVLLLFPGVCLFRASGKSEETLCAHILTMGPSCLYRHILLRLLTFCTACVFGGSMPLALCFGMCFFSCTGFSCSRSFGDNCSTHFRILRLQKGSTCKQCTNAIFVLAELSSNRFINPHRYMYLKNRKDSPADNCRNFFGTPFRPEHRDFEFGKTTLDAF